VAHPLTMLMQMTGMHLDLLPAPSSCLEGPQQRQVSPRLQLPVDRPPSLLCANAHWRTSLQRKSRVATLNVAAAGEDAQESDEDKNSSEDDEPQSNVASQQVDSASQEVDWSAARAEQSDEDA